MNDRSAVKKTRGKEPSFMAASKKTRVTGRNEESFYYHLFSKRGNFVLRKHTFKLFNVTCNCIFARILLKDNATHD